MKKTQVKSVLVIGSSSGIGAAVAQEYAKKGYKISIAARRKDRLEEVASLCHHAGAKDVFVRVTDVTDKEQCKKLIEEVIKKYEVIDVLVYAVGQAMHSLVVEISDINAVYNKMMEVNFYGAVYCTYYALPFLQCSKGQLVIISSVADAVSPPFCSLYTAAKHAVRGFFEALINEEPGFDITVACPGYVATEFDDKKVVGDGSVKAVDLNTDKNKYMTADKCAALIVEAARKKKNKVHYLTPLSNVGVTIKSVFPGFVDKQVRKEMANITKTQKD